MSAYISQAKARALRKRVNELESQRSSLRSGWSRDYPEGEHLFSLAKGDHIAQEELDMVRVSRKLGHPVIVTHDSGNLHFYGMRTP